MQEKYLKIVLEALAEKIDRLNAEVFIRDLQKEERDKAIEELKEENSKLYKTVKLLEKAIAQEVAEDG